jgi:hypothetical protein
LQDITSDKRGQFQKSSRVESTVNEEMLWMWHGDSLGAQRKWNVHRCKPVSEES